MANHGTTNDKHVQVAWHARAFTVVLSGYACVVSHDFSAEAGHQLLLLCDYQCSSFFKVGTVPLLDRA